MKRINSIFFAAAATALSLVSCSQENLAPTEKPQGELVTVHFGAESGIASSTKATLTTEDETKFTSAWENGDVLSVEFLNGQLDEGVVPAEWAGSYFKADLPGFQGDWEYNALYPAPSSTGTVDFGSNRTQNGNEYNSHYDLMIGNASAKNATAGKDDSGKDIIFEMNRQTAIAYFHLTSGLDEEVVSATLSVEGEIAVIATKSAKVSKYSEGYKFLEDEANALKEITITFEGETPKATDFQLWFNVLPTVYDKMTLTVETTGHTMSISRTSKEDTYEAGKLYKVVKEIPTDKWSEKKISGLTFDFSSKITDWPTSETEAKDGSYSYTLDGKNYSFIHDGGKVYCSSSYLMIRTGSRLGLPAIAGYRLAKVACTNSSSASTSTKVDIENVNAVTVSGGEIVTWSKRSSTYTYTLSDTHENTMYYLDVTSANCQLVSLVLDYEPAESAYSISVLDVDGGKVTADSDRALAGSEITLTATPETGYEFKAWDVKDSDEVPVEVSDGKFTMPAKDVTVSAVFAKIEYTIEKLEAANGTFTVKVNGEEATVANYGDVVTLEATPNEDYEFGAWTVKRKSNGTAITVSDNKFTMPSANISVTATFVEVAKVPEYSSLEELVAAGAPTSTEQFVTVTLSDEVITKLYVVSNKYTNGAYFNVGAQEIQIYCKNTPSYWKVGGLVSGTLTNCKWVLYNKTWELCPNDYTEMTFTPAPVINCEDVTVEAGDSQHSLKYEISNPLDGAAVSIDKFDGAVVTNATIDEAMSSVVCTLAPNTTTSTKKGSVTIKYAHVSKTVSITQEANTLSVDQNTKTWASDATDEFVINVKVNNGASWTVSPTSLDWATVSVDNAAGTIKVKPNGVNDSGAAYEGKLTVTHTSATSLTETITLKQLQAGASESILVWDDDFSSLTKASTSSMSSLSGSKDGFKDAYTVSNCYPEVNSVKLSSSSKIGSLQTPKFSKLSSTASVVVTIEYAGYGDGGTINLSVVGNGTLDVTSLTATNTATSGAAVKTWDKATIVISGADKDTALKMTASANKKRFFINSIRIETK